MSECVVRMEIPTNCWVCPFGLDGYIWNENDARTHYVRFCSRHSGEEFHVLEIDTLYRPWFCDSFICQLPEGHGRLVDSDEIMQAIDEDIELDSRGLDDMYLTGSVRERLRMDVGYKNGFKEYMRKRPTVVPA